MRNKYYKITLTAQSPLLVGGVTPDPVLDSRTAMKDDKPFIPASAFKGALRILFEEVMRTLGKDFLNSIGEEVDICSITEQKFANDVKEGCGKCLVCRLFGGGGKEGKLRFNDMSVRDKEDLVVLTQATISRKTGRSVKHKLFNRGFAPSGIVFTGEIDVIEPLEEKEALVFNKFLDYLREIGLFIGNSRSTGKGFLTLDWEDKEYEEDIEIPEDPGEDWELLKAEIKTKEPVNMGAGKNRYVLSTLRFIPASTVRGAVAYALLQEGVEEKTIEKFFIGDGKEKVLRFGNFYVGEAEPNLLTYRRPKRHNFPVYDILVPEYLLNVYYETEGMLHEDLYNAVFFDKKEENNIPLEPLPVDPGEPKVRLYTKLTISRKTGAAAKERLYTVEALEPEITFKGYIWAPQNWTSKVKALPLRVGSKRSRGFGHGEFKITRETADWDIEKRSLELTETIYNYAGKYEISLPDNRVYFTVDLLSELKLDDGESFRNYLLKTLGSATVKVERGWVATDVRGGFDQLETTRQGSPHFKDRAKLLKRGSVVLLSVPNENWEEVKNKLIQLLKTGLGTKPYEGYGMFTVSHPKHVKENKLNYK